MNNKKKIFMLLFSVIIGFIVGSIVISIAGFNPLEYYKIILETTFSKPKFFGRTLVDAVPLVIGSIGVSLAFKTGAFNIGAEGQFIVGALTAAFFGYFLKLPPIIHPIVCILLAALAGMIWGGFAGWVKAKFGVHEVITTIMLNWIALYFSNLVVTFGSFYNENAQASNEIRETASIKMFQGLKESSNSFIKGFFSSDINFGVFLMIILAILVYYLLNKTSKGYELKAVGLNPHAAEFGGINVSKNLILSMGMSGALCAVAGAVKVLGFAGNVARLTVMEGNGFDSMSVALLANSSPIGSIFSGFFFSILRRGGFRVQQVLGVPYEIVQIIIGIIVLFISMPLFIRIISKKFKKNKKVGGKN